MRRKEVFKHQGTNSSVRSHSVSAENKYPKGRYLPADLQGPEAGLSALRGDRQDLPGRAGRRGKLRRFPQLRSTTTGSRSSTPSRRRSSPSGGRASSSRSRAWSGRPTRSSSISREMGNISLLTREGEIAIAREIERGEKADHQGPVQDAARPERSPRPRGEDQGRPDGHPGDVRRQRGRHRRGQARGKKEADPGQDQEDQGPQPQAGQDPARSENTSSPGAGSSSR